MNHLYGQPPRFTEDVNGHLVFAIFASSFGSAFQHGYHSGVMNNPNEMIRNWSSEIIQNRTLYFITPHTYTVSVLWSTIVAIFAFGGVLGGMLTCVLADSMGRKGTMILNSFISIVGIFIMGFSRYAKSYELMIIGRLLVGINAGLSAGVCPMYLIEIAPCHIRGAICSCYQVMLTFSIFVSQIISLKEVLGNERHWPYIFWISGIPALLQIVMLCLIPESPKHLFITQTEDEKAEESLVWLRKTWDVELELEDMKSEDDILNDLPKPTVGLMFTDAALRTPLAICLIATLGQQCSGIVAIIYFSNDIFVKAGFTGNDPHFITIGMGAFHFIVTIGTVFMIELIGRRLLLIAGFLGLIIVTLLLTIFLVLADVFYSAKFLTLLLMLFFIIIYAIGVGAIPWVLTAELFPHNVRPMAASLIVPVNFLVNFIVGISFVQTAGGIGYYIFIIFLCLDCFFLFFIIVYVPETKQLSPQQIIRLFRHVPET